jgi:seryl-tRNA synthetase
MSDTDTPTTPAAPAAPADQPKADPPANTVPYDRFTEVNEKSKRLSAELEELRQWKDEQESKSLSELERERKRAEAAEKTAQEAEQRVTNLERGSWVRAAATEAGFLDPSDAIQFIDLTDTETETQARNAVKRLAESKKHLLRPTDEKPALTRVLSSQQDAPKAADTPPSGEEAKNALGEGILTYLQGQRG